MDAAPLATPTVPPPSLGRLEIRCPIDDRSILQLIGRGDTFASAALS